MMQRKHLFPLAATVALLLLAAWQWLDPVPASAPQTPHFGSNAQTPAAASTHSIAKPDPEASPNTLPQRPNSPAVTNDPNKGEVWLRVIDAQTNQPLANTDCELWWLSGDDGYRYSIFGRDENGNYLRDNNRPVGKRSTDANGCLRVSATVITEPIDFDADPPAEPPAEPSVKIEATWRIEPDRMRFPLPVPRNWQAYAPLQALGSELYALATTPRTTPVDIVVKRELTLSGQVRDIRGSGLPAMTVYAFPVWAPPASHGWALLMTEAYFVAQVYSGNDIRSGPVPFIPEAESELVQELRDLIEQPWLGTERTKPSIGARAMWSNPPTRSICHQATTDSSGAFTLEGLHDGTWIVVCYSEHRAMSHAKVTLANSQSGMDLVANQRGLGSAELNLTPVGATDADVMLSLRHIPAPEVRFVDGVEFDLQLRDSACSVARPLPVGGLVAGLWALRWHVDGLWHETTFVAQPGKCASVELTVGDGACGTWTPRVLFDGTVMPDIPIYLAGGEYNQPTQLEIQTDDEGNELPATKLGSGDYVAWVDGLPPLCFTLAAGEFRTDFFSLPVATAAFSIDASFAAAISHDSTPDFELRCTGTFGDHPAVVFTTADARESDQRIDIVLPGRTTVWRVPAGEYRWYLTGFEYNVNGAVTLKPGMNSVHFSMDSLPGLARLEILAPEATEENPLDLRVMPADTDSARLPAPRAGEPWHIERDRASTNLAPEAGLVLSFDHGKRWLVWAPAGSYRVFASCNGKYGEQPVFVPGRSTIKLNKTFRDPAASLKLVSDDEDSATYAGTIYTSEGLHEVAIFKRPEPFSAGPVRVLIYRDQLLEDGTRVPSFASAEIVLKSGEGAELNVTALSYVAAAHVTIRCTGRGGAGATIDPWWSGFGGTAPKIRALVSLDRAGPGTHTFIELGAPDEVLPANRVEFAYLGRTLPPGRYRAIPWEGAPEKYCRSFELKPGQREVVLIDTSR